MSQIEWEEIYSRPGFRDKNNYPMSSVVSFVMRHLNVKNTPSILEIGSGWGNNLKFFSDITNKYIGIEQSKTAVDYCKSIGLNAICDDFLNYEFSDSFDLIIDRQALQHNSYEYIDQSLEKISSILKPKGYFFSEFISQADYDVETTYFSPSDYDQILKKYFSLVETNIQRTFDIEEKLFYELVYAVVKR